MVENTTGETLVQEEPLKTAGEGAEAPGGKRPAESAAADPQESASESAGASGGKRFSADTLREEASKLGGQAADRARAFAGEGKDRATSALDEVATMMRNAAGDVDAKLGEEYGRYARSAADGIANFASSLRGKEVDDLVDDVTGFVRKSPVIAVGTAAALGFVLARLIKSGIDAAADLADRDDSTPSGKA